MTKSENQFTQDKEQFIKEYGDLGEALLKEYGLENAKKAMEDYYVGEFYSREDFAKTYIRERADEMLPQGSFEHHFLYNHCNWQHATWELFVNDFRTVEANGMTHVFHAFK